MSVSVKRGLLLIKLGYGDGLTFIRDFVWRISLGVAWNFSAPPVHSGIQYSSTSTGPDLFAKRSAFSPSVSNGRELH
jgi:hypothetical protein